MARELKSHRQIHSGQENSFQSPLVDLQSTDAELAAGVELVSQRPELAQPSRTSLSGLIRTNMSSKYCR